MKLSKRQLKRIIREEFNKVSRRRLLKEGQFKNFLIETEEFLSWEIEKSPGLYPGRIPLDQAIQLIKGEFALVQDMSDMEIKEILISYDDVFSMIDVTPEYVSLSQEFYADSDDNYYDDASGWNI
tara:strand:+ start:2331 stop:2705 length:375 start_codon:yes stop_codon:yes gene_type:complete